MRTRPTCLAGLSLLVAFAGSCDDITTGRLPDETGPPVLNHVLIQDATFAGGRRMATDLLEIIREPGERCSTLEPCPAGEAYQSIHCRLPDPAVDDGQCPRPLRPQETPAPSTSNRLLGTQIRIVFSKAMANDIDSSMYDTVAQRIVYTLRPDIDKSIGLFDEQGREVSTTKYYDPAGSPNATSDLFFQPYGPALVIKPKLQLVPRKNYSVRFDPNILKDRLGQSVAANDRFGTPVQTEYPFQVEYLYIIDPENGGGNVGYDQLKRIPGGQKVKPEQAVVLFANWPFDPLSVTASARNAAGEPVRVAATAELGDQPSSCRDRISNERINVIPVDQNGKRSIWAVGFYTLDVTATALDVDGQTLKADNLGTSEFKGVKFEVKVADVEEKYDPTKDIFATQNLLLPDECPLPPAADGGVPNPDMVP